MRSVARMEGVLPAMATRRARATTTGRRTGLRMAAGAARRRRSEDAGSEPGGEAGAGEVAEGSGEDGEEAGFGVEEEGDGALCWLRGSA